MGLSHKSQLIASAVLASSATAALFVGYTIFSRRSRRRDLDKDVLRSIQQNSMDRQPASLSASEPSLDYDETLIREQLARTYAFYGDEAMSKIRGSSIAIVGLGVVHC